MEKITESPSLHDNLEQQPISDLFELMNLEDKKVANAVEESKAQIIALAEVFYETLNNNHKVFYIGSGTSGRLGVVDASELPPTFGVSKNLVVGIIAGGDAAIRSAQEGAEDDTKQAMIDLIQNGYQSGDLVIGISASGSTPYVLGGLIDSKKSGAKTGCIVCNPNSNIASVVQYPIEVVVGPEFVTGSTRLKAGTAQKLVLNMLSTLAMIKFGKVKGNKMVDMQLSNDKLVDRGTKLIIDALGFSYEEAQQHLLALGSVRAVIDKFSPTV
jgi:N-acetylmuramic acid 6-phosphate etherase